MRNVLLQFTTNLSRAREMGGLASAISKITTSSVDVSDMWRAQMVLSVSALDFFIHELVRYGMLEIAKETRPKTDSYAKFQLPLDAAELAFQGQSHDIWLGSVVREKHSWLSFQKPDKIADAIRLISSVKLWDELAKEFGCSSKDIKLQLELIVDRRNCIAHEADMDPTNPGFRWPISEVLANEAVDFIEHLAHAIFKVVN